MGKPTQEIGLNNKLGDFKLIKVSRMKPVIKPTTPHKHEGYHELIFLSRGAGFHQIDLKKIEVRPPMGFYLRPGQVHCWDFCEIPRGFVILFKDEVLDSFGSTQNRLNNIPSLFSLQNNPEFFDLTQQFYEHYKTDAEPDILSAFLNILVLKTLSLGHLQPISLPAEMSNFHAFKSSIEANFLKFRQVRQYAESLNISAYRLNAICQSVTHKTASEIIKERIVLEAKNLITHTSLSVSEISYRLNFTDSSNFVKFFKARTALTPSEYREKALNPSG